MQLEKNYEETIIDLGTGDGRFVYKYALAHPETLVIGVDPSASQLEVYAKKARKKRLKNTKFLVGSLEIPPKELLDKADKLYINFPWGTLLQGIVKPTPKSIGTMGDMLKPEGTLEIILGYAQENEPTETKRLSLPEIDKPLLDTISAVFSKHGLIPTEQVRLDKEQLRNLETSWGKRLAFGKNRPIYKLTFKRAKIRG